MDYRLTEEQQRQILKATTQVKPILENSRLQAAIQTLSKQLDREQLSRVHEQVMANAELLRARDKAIEAVQSAAIGPTADDLRKLHNSLARVDFSELAALPRERIEEVDAVATEVEQADDPEVASQLRLALVVAVMSALTALFDFLEDVSGEDIPDGAQSAMTLLVAILAVVAAAEE